MLIFFPLVKWNFRIIDVFLLTVRFPPNSFSQWLIRIYRTALCIYFIIWNSWNPFSYHCKLFLLICFNPFFTELFGQFHSLWSLSSEVCWGTRPFGISSALSETIYCLHWRKGEWGGGRVTRSLPPPLYPRELCCHVHDREHIVSQDLGAHNDNYDIISEHSPLLTPLCVKWAVGGENEYSKKGGGGMWEQQCQSVRSFILVLFIYLLPMIRVLPKYWRKLSYYVTKYQFLYLNEIRRPLGHAFMAGMGKKCSDLIASISFCCK